MTSTPKTCDCVAPDTCVECKPGPKPKWLEGQHHQNSPKSKKHETRLAKSLGGKRYRGSGNKRWSRWADSSDTDKGDLATPTFHFEHKFTRHASISVTVQWLDKVGEGARKRNKQPGLIVTFDGGPTKKPEDWVMVPLDALQALLKKATDDES